MEQTHHLVRPRIPLRHPASQWFHRWCECSQLYVESIHITTEVLARSISMLVLIQYQGREIHGVTHLLWGGCIAQLLNNFDSLKFGFFSNLLFLRFILLVHLCALYLILNSAGILHDSELWISICLSIHPILNPISHSSFTPIGWCSGLWSGVPPFSPTLSALSVTAAGMSHVTPHQSTHVIWNSLNLILTREWGFLPEKGERDMAHLFIAIRVFFIDVPVCRKWLWFWIFLVPKAIGGEACIRLNMYMSQVRFVSLRRNGNQCIA